MSTVTRTKKHVRVSSENVKFRERIMTQFALDYPFNMRIDKDNNNIVLRRAHEIDFSKLQLMIVEIAAARLEPVTIVDDVEDKKTTVDPYKSWYWFGQRLATTSTKSLNEEEPETSTEEATEDVEPDTKKSKASKKVRK